MFKLSGTAVIVVTCCENPTYEVGYNKKKGLIASDFLI